MKPTYAEILEWLYVILTTDSVAMGEPDWIELARAAGYDGSPGGEQEWCIGNGMDPRQTQD